MFDKNTTINNNNNLRIVHKKGFDKVKSPLAYYVEHIGNEYTILSCVYTGDITYVDRPDFKNLYKYCNDPK